MKPTPMLFSMSETDVNKIAVNMEIFQHRCMVEGKIAQSVLE